MWQKICQFFFIKCTSLTVLYWNVCMYRCATFDSCKYYDSRPNFVTWKILIKFSNFAGFWICVSEPEVKPPSTFIVSLFFLFPSGKQFSCLCLIPSLSLSLSLSIYLSIYLSVRVVFIYLFCDMIYISSITHIDVQICMYTHTRTHTYA